MAKRKSELVKYLEGMRTWANKEFPRNDAYGRGLKAGIDDAIHAARQIEKGLVHDAENDLFVEPKPATT